MPEDMLTGVNTAARNAIFTKVGDLVTILWDLSLGAFVNFILLGKNAEKLEDEMLRLEELKDDLSGMVDAAARQRMMEVNKEVSGWIKRVDKLKSKVNRFQDSYGTQSICITGFRLGYDAVQLQREVDKLIEQRDTFPRGELVRERDPIAIEEVPLDIPSSSLVGAEKTIRQIQGHIMDDAVGVVGICGMGGAGKTTILKIINNEFLREGEARDMFNLSILVTVSHTVDILRIQKSIGDRLDLTLSSSQQGEPSDGSLMQEQAKTLFRELSKKRFILFLDDIWKKIELVKIGIPCPDKSKKQMILFTTRSEEVCNEMDADKIVKVGLLDTEDSRTLFRSKMSKKAAALDNQKVRELTNQVVAKCGGLPISLITVGRAMANATTIPEWRGALHALHQCEGMDQVLTSLKFSYDMLKNTNGGVNLQSCLLYCALYPEDRNIRKGEIIDYWISEGFLDSTGDIYTPIDGTRDSGHLWIRRLQNACLLEDGNVKKTVRLHDTIRDMLLSIGREEYVIFDGDNIAQIQKREIWKKAKGIYLMYNKTSQVPSFFPELKCEALTTLLLQSSVFPRTIQKGFFGCTPSLRVLDLSNTQIEALPSDITTLAKLRYLNLKGTPIASLPEELGELTNLRYLNLNYTDKLKKIPREAVSRLTSLQVLKLWRSKYDLTADSESESESGSEFGLSDLKNLHLICELSATVKLCSSWHDIAVSNTFSGCSKKLGVLFWPENLKFGHFPNLKFLEFFGFEGAEIVIEKPTFGRLRVLCIDECNGLRDLTWVGQLPLLECIRVNDCKKITELLDDGDCKKITELLDDGDLPNGGRTIFPKLDMMDLRNLPSLKSISKHVLHFPSLCQLDVAGCPNLKRLPFGPESAENLWHISGSQEWWDGLVWDQPDVKLSFLDRFVAYW